MAQPLKILALSDRVLDHLYHSRVAERYPDLDLLIGCGDLPFYYLDFLVSALNVPLVYVRGNHDRSPQYTAEGRVLHRVPGGEDIHGRSLMVKDLLLAGLEGSMRYRPDAPLMYSERAMRFEIGRLLPTLLWNRMRYGRFLDVLVTHSPPYGVHDQKDRPHTGFRQFLSLMRRFRPRYLLHGHIHIYAHNRPRVTQYEDTTVINVYPYQILHIEPFDAIV